MLRMQERRPGYILFFEFNKVYWYLDDMQNPLEGFGCFYPIAIDRGSSIPMHLLERAYNARYSVAWRSRSGGY